MSPFYQMSRQWGWVGREEDRGSDEWNQNPRLKAKVLGKIRQW